jgi:predicted ATPase
MEKPLEHMELANLFLRNNALISALPYRRELEDRINSFLEGILGITIQFEFHRGKRLNITARSSKGEHALINEGLGAQQLFHLFFSVALAGDREMIFIEEPENHLHPKAQAELVSALLRARRSKDVQYVLSTHSEHILMNILLGVKEGLLKPKDLAVYSFSRDPEGDVKVERLKVNGKGQVKGGIPDFFEANMELISNLFQ